MVCIFNNKKAHLLVVIFIFYLSLSSGIRTFELTQAADAETRSARSRRRSPESGAVGRAIAGAVRARARAAGVVLEAHDREEGQDWNEDDDVELMTFV